MHTDPQRAEAGVLPQASASWSIRLDDVSVTYPNGTRALSGVSLDIAAGEMVSVVGLSGSGKSTLIRTINGLVPATSGTVTVGKRADLVLLSGNPLQDVRHAAEPAGVLLGGRWLPRAELDRHLAQLTAAAAP